MHVVSLQTSIAALLAVALTVGVVGCREELPPPNQPTTPSASNQPTDPGPTPDPTTDPVANLPEEPETFPANVIIDDTAVEFPPVVLVLRTDGDETTALLYTDDPRELLDDDYRGNSFYFEMPLGALTVDEVLTGRNPDAPAGRRLTTAFSYVVEESRRTGTPNGLFLDGGAFVLQPKNAEFILDPNGNALTVEVRGLFSRFAGDELFSGEQVTIRATLIPEVVTE